MNGFLSFVNRVQTLPVWVRYLLATLIVIAAFCLRLLLQPYIPAFPFIIFFPAVLFCAFVFDRGSGVYAAVLSAALALYFFLPPERSFHMADLQVAVATTLFLAIGIGGALLIELLRNSLMKVAAAEQDKDMLLLEINHRIKNDLQTLGHLFRIQADMLRGNPDCAEALRDAVNRVGVMGRVYSRLHRRGATHDAEVDASAYLEDLCADLRASLIGPRPIALRISAEPVEINQGRAISIGLIVNELITNAVKYAFPDGRAGSVEVRFGRAGRGSLRLAVADDGIGMPEPVQRGGVGYRIVGRLAEQLGGALERQSAPGTGLVLTFPEAAPA